MKPRSAFFSIILLLFIVKNLPVFCQQIIFNKILPPDGNSFGWVTGITQDLNGYMWIATYDGLYHYDGYRLTPYVHDPLNPNSLADKSVESVYTDPDGTIWVGTSGAGLDRFDPVTGIFTHFNHDAKDPASLSNNNVTAILRDRQGILWIGTHGGLNQFNPKTKKFIHYLFNATDPASVSNNHVRVIYEDKQGTLWIGTGNRFPEAGSGPEEGGLNRLNKKTGIFTRYLHDPSNIHSLVNNKVSAIFEDTHGVLWIGTAGNGLHKMDRQRGSFERILYDPAYPEKLSGPPLKKGPKISEKIKKETGVYEQISFITQDAAESYWIGSSDDGLNYYNPGIGKTIHYNGTDNSSAGFNEKGAWRTFTSRDGILWIGTPYENWISTPGGNLYRVNPFRKTIPRYVTSSHVNFFCEEPKGILWIGTRKGLLRKNLHTQQEKFWLHDSLNENSLADNWVMSIRPDTEGNLWLATHLGGVDRFDPKTEKFTHYKHDENNPASLLQDFTHCLFFDNQKMLWISTHIGLSRMDIKTGLYTNYKHDRKDSLTLSYGQTYNIVQEKNGTMWVATDGGICRFDSKSGKFHRYLTDKGMNAVSIDANGFIWAGGNGLFYFDSKKDDFIKFTSSGFPKGIDEILGVVEDDKNNLWITTKNTLIRINEKRDELKVYNALHGILTSNSVWRENYKAKDGRLFLGSDSGYYSFYPDEMNEPRTGLLLHLNTFSIGNKEIYTGKGSTLSPPLWKMENIRLRYNQNTFSFDFSAIDYKTPGNMNYLYMLEKYDIEWRDIGTEHKASFFNVPSGKYVFRVKAINGEGTVTEKSITVIINPPWWLTWWAFCMYGLLLSAVVITGFLFQKRRIVLAERQRTQKRELEHAKEIEEAYTELKATQAQLIQSEKMASLGGLTAGIAHEIQNPLNFVNNFSEVNKELLVEMKSEMDKGNLESAKALANDVMSNEEKINHHGKRADAIVKGMLQHSRKSTGIKEPTDINLLADEYFRLSYHGMRAKDKSFNATMKSDFDPSIGKISVIPQDLGRVILNLINNAFYAVAEKKNQEQDDYEPTVSVSTKRTGSNVEIKVRDNGNGIPQNIVDKIFQPFFTTKPTGQGTGLGLSLAYDIVKAHGGEINVKTEENKGSEFIIILPL
ncbi:MAG: two-component regulator propeller domain-containing protein [Chitinophagaceae bacterium]